MSENKREMTTIRTSRDTADFVAKIARALELVFNRKFTNEEVILIAMKTQFGETGSVLDRSIELLNQSVKHLEFNPDADNLDTQ